MVGVPFSKHNYRYMIVLKNNELQTFSMNIGYFNISNEYTFIIEDTFGQYSEEFLLEDVSFRKDLLSIFEIDLTGVNLKTDVRYIYKLVDELYNNIDSGYLIVK